MVEEKGKGKRKGKVVVVVLKVRFEGVAVKPIEVTMVKGEEDGGEWVMNDIENGFWF